MDHPQRPEAPTIYYIGDVADGGGRGQREAEPTAGADKRKLQSAERARLFYFNLNKARAFRLGVLFRCWRRSISTALRLGSGKREAALAGADKTPTKADGIVVDEPAAPPRSSGRKKVAGTLIFSDG